METLLKTQDTVEPSQSVDIVPADTDATVPADQEIFSQLLGQNDFSQSPLDIGLQASMTFNNDFTSPSGPSPWEMIGLGLEEPLPPQEDIDEL